MKQKIFIHNQEIVISIRMHLFLKFDQEIAAKKAQKYVNFGIYRKKNSAFAFPNFKYSIPLES